MATVVQFRGGDTSQNNAFRGASKELTVDTQKHVVVVHDGSNDGGHPLMAEDGTNSALALGSAGTPALKFTDTDTGIYSPGPNQIALSTGGTGRLFVDSSGNIGCGTSAPAAKLHVENGDVRLEKDSKVTIGFKGHTSGSTALAFRDTNAAVDQMTIDSSGNVMIGKTSASAKLDVNGNVQFGDGGGFDMNINGTRHQFSLGSSEKMRLTSTGLGIGGQRNPSVLLDLESTSPTIRLTDSDATGTPECQISGAGGDLVFEADRDNEKSSSLIRFEVDGSERMTIDGSGILTAGTGTGTNAITINGSGSSTSVNRLIFYGGGTNNPSAAIEYDGADKGIAFQIGNYSALSSSEVARIDTSGRLLVGTSSTTVTSTLVLQGNSTSSSSQANLNISCGTVTPSNGQALGLVAFGDGNQATGAQITARADAAGWTSGSDRPSRLEFSTTDSGTTTLDVRMTIKNDGRINMANIPAFTDDAAADAAAAANPPTLQSGDLYTVSRVLKVLP